MSKQTNIEMSVRDYNAVEYYLRDRLTEKEIELVNSFVDLENMEDVDELYTALNQDTLVDMMTWELKEVSTDDFIEEFSTFRKLNRIVKKLWNNNHEVIKKLKDIYYLYVNFGSGYGDEHICTYKTFWDAYQDAETFRKQGFRAKIVKKRVKL